MRSSSKEEPIIKDLDLPGVMYSVLDLFYLIKFSISPTTKNLSFSQLEFLKD